MADAPDPPDLQAALHDTAEQRDGFRQHAEILEREPETRAEIEEELKNNVWAP